MPTCTCAPRDSPTVLWMIQARHRLHHALQMLPSLTIFPVYINQHLSTDTLSLRIIIRVGRTRQNVHNIIRGLLFSSVGLSP